MAECTNTDCVGRVGKPPILAKSGCQAFGRQVWWQGITRVVHRNTNVQDGEVLVGESFVSAAGSLETADTFSIQGVGSVGAVSLADGQYEKVTAHRYLQGPPRYDLIDVDIDSFVDLPFRVWEKSRMRLAYLLALWYEAGYQDDGTHQLHCRCRIIVLLYRREDGVSEVVHGDGFLF